MAQFVFVGWLVKFFESRDFEFEWDDGNRFKSVEKHDVGNEVSEEAFFDEERYGIIGKSLEGKIIFVNFTFRNLKIRIISSRLGNIREKKYYEKNKR